jgi:hypothetical protein
VALAKNGYALGQNLEYQPYGAAMQIALLPQLATDVAANRSMLRSSWAIQPQRL